MAAKQRQAVTESQAVQGEIPQHAGAMALAEAAIVGNDRALKTGVVSGTVVRPARADLLTGAAAVRRPTSRNRTTWPSSVSTVAHSTNTPRERACRPEGEIAWATLANGAADHAAVQETSCAVVTGSEKRCKKKGRIRVPFSRASQDKP